MLARFVFSKKRDFARKATRWFAITAATDTQWKK